ncbi:acyl-CoA thioesterase [Jatrophihabitans sp. YIM 134969]
MPFSTATALTPTGEDRWTGEVSAEWTIAGKPNGGYLLAMLARAVTTSDTHPHVLAASAHYLRSPDPGPVVVEVETLRAGRSASQLRARLRQGDATAVEALFTTGRLDPDTSPTWDAGAPGVDLPAPDDLLRVPPVTPLGTEARAMAQVDMRLDPSCGGFTIPPTGRGELRATLALQGDEDFDPLSLLYAVDALPPATFDIGPSGWVPTLELTAYVRALPAPGPVTVRQTAHLVEAGRVDERCWVWDSRGRLVAQATQLAGIRFV